MADATGDFFAELGRRGHEPLLQKLTGTFRFDVTGGRDEHWFVDVSKGDVTVSRRNDKADCSVRSDQGRLRRGRRRRGERARRDPARRGGHRRRHRSARRVPAPVPRATGREGEGEDEGRRRQSPAARPRRRSGHDGRRQDPRRQHLRRERQAGRHRGVVDGSFRSLLVRHALHLAVGADDRRQAADRALGRRSALLGDALLPRAGNGVGVHRLEGVRDPAARRRRRISRGDHDPQPRREADPAHRTHRRGLGFRRPLRGQGRAREEGQLFPAGRARPARARLRARDVQARDGHRGDDPGQGRRGRPHVQGPHRVARRVVHRRRRRRRRRARRFRQARAAAEALAAGHAEESRPLARAGAPARMRFGRIEGDLPPLPRRSCGTAFLTGGRRRQEPAGGRAAVVHDDVRPRQHLHEPAGAAVHVGAGPRDPARARGVAGNAHGRLPRRGSRADHARDALRRVDGVRGAAPLAVLRRSRHDPPLRGPARRVRALDR